MAKKLLLLIVCVLVAVLGTGCPSKTDYGESASCFPKAVWEGLGRPTWGGGITPIESDGPWPFLLYPGQIASLTVKGGDDKDYSTTAVEPNGKCTTSCDSDKLCIAEISNRNVKYMLSGFTGYLQEVYQDVDDPMGRRFYFEAKKETITTNEPFTLTIYRMGASKGEYNGADNFASTTFHGEVQPPTLFTLFPVKNPRAREQDIAGMLQRGSLKLREDKPKHNGTLTLKQRKNETKDEHVPVEYQAGDMKTAWEAPVDVQSEFFFPIIYELMVRGYDILACDSIDDGDPDPTFGITWTMYNFIGVSVLAPNPDRTLLHEVGHCVGLDHWDVDAPTVPDSYWNIMRTSNAFGGPYSGEAMDISGAYPSGDSQAKRYKKGLWLWEE